MSKQSDNKLKQGYEEIPVYHTCANCELCNTMRDIYGNANSRYCALGNFKVKATATCKYWERSKLI